MAKELITRLRDDLDDTLGEDVATYPFSWRGTDYEIELNAANIARYDEAMAPLIAVARKVTGRRAPLGTRHSVLEHLAKDDAPEVPENTRKYRDRVRKWGNRNGFKIKAKGAIPAAAREAYEAARRGKVGVDKAVVEAAPVSCQHVTVYESGPRQGQCARCHAQVEAPAQGQKPVVVGIDRRPVPEHGEISMETTYLNVMKLLLNLPRGDYDGLTRNEVARRLGISKNAATYRLKVLKRDGLVNNPANKWHWHATARARAYRLVAA
jgi:Lsr2/MarR family